MKDRKQKLQIGFGLILTFLAFGVGTYYLLNKINDQSIPSYKMFMVAKNDNLEEIIMTMGDGSENLILMKEFEITSQTRQPISSRGVEQIDVIVPGENTPQPAHSDEESETIVIDLPAFPALSSGLYKLRIYYDDGRIIDGNALIEPFALTMDISKDKNGDLIFMHEQEGFNPSLIYYQSPMGSVTKIRADRGEVLNLDISQTIQDTHTLLVYYQDDWYGGTTSF